MDMECECVSRVLPITDYPMTEGNSVYQQNMPMSRDVEFSNLDKSTSYNYSMLLELTNITSNILHKANYPLHIIFVKKNFRGLNLFATNYLLCSSISTLVLCNLQWHTSTNYHLQRKIELFQIQVFSHR